MLHGPAHRKHRRFLRLTPVKIGVAAAVAAATLTAGVAFATIPDSAGLFHGCVNKLTGELRVIDTSRNKHCVVAGRNAETPISWNQSGSVGATGATGQQGPVGATGAQGPKGDTGPVLAYAIAQTSERDTFDTNGTWVPLPGGSITMQVAAPGVLDARFSASVACFGTGRKYLEIVFDQGHPPVPGGAGDIGEPFPLAPYPPNTNDIQQESATSAESTMAITTSGPHTVSVSIYTQPGSYCVITENLWRLVVESLAP